jgi:hypothetical protein
VTKRPLTIYVDASLLTDETGPALAADLDLLTVTVPDEGALPDDLEGAWYLTADQPESGARHWSRSIVIGPAVEPGRRTVTGLRMARDLRLAILELASEHATD